jgi:hypothetical protein
MRTKFWSENLKGRKKTLGRLGGDERIILKWIFGKWGGEV